jgi:hypothetical protein
MTATFRAIAWVIRDTWQQALATRAAWLVVAACTIGISLGALVDVGSQPVFGAEPWNAHALCGAWLPNSVGVLFALFATAGVLPTFLEPRHALVLFAKPTRRWRIAATRYIGVCLFVAVLAGFYFIASWIFLGLRTGRWPLVFLTGWFVFLVQFTVFFSFSALLAVSTRSTPVAALGSCLFWIASLLTNLGRQIVIAYDPPQFRQATRQIIELSYWCMPRPLDAASVLHDRLNPEPLMATLDFWRRLEESGQLWPMASLLATVVITFFLMAAAVYDLETRDY